MPTLSRPTASEIVQKGKEIYEIRLRKDVEPGNLGKYIAIDILSAEYEIGDDHLETVNALHVRVPTAIACVLKIGYPATDVIGGRMVSNAD